MDQTLPNPNAVTQVLHEVWESANTYTPVADAPEVDGVHILAKVEGPAFFPDGVSGNRVFYPASMWDEVLEDPRVISALETRTMFGSIGHDIVMNDDAMRRGLASHITTRMWVDEATGIGMATYLILNTPVGRILNTVIRAGAKLRVSTKAQGSFGPSRADGTKQLDAYFFERIDFVMSPGFKDALPSISESLSEEDQEVLNKIVSVSESPDQQEVNPMDDKAVTILEGQVNDLKAQLSECQNKLNEEQTAHGATRSELAGFKAVAETPDEVNEALNNATTTIRNLNEALHSAGELVAQDISESEAINESLAQYQALGTPEELTKILEISESIAELGSVEELTKLVEVSEAAAKAELDATLEKFAKKKGIPVAAVVAVYESQKQDLSAVATLLDINEDDNSDDDNKDANLDPKDAKKVSPGTGDDKPKNSDDDLDDQGNPKKKDDVDESLKTQTQRPSRISMLTSGQLRTNLVSKKTTTDVNESQQELNQTSRASRLMSRK